VAIHPAGQFLYAAARRGCLVVFRIDPATGALSHIAGSPFPGFSDPTALALDPLGRYLFQAGPSLARYSEATVSSIRRDETTGAPVPPGTQAAALGARAFGLAVHPSGRFVFVTGGTEYPAFDATLSTFAVDRTTGGLSLAGTPPPTGRRAEAVAVSSSGRFVAVASYLQDFLFLYRVDASTGALTLMPGSPVATGDEPVAVTFVERR
jgi:6-phosphogluconolactonase (cycloisomerase 2 family)